MSHHIGELGFFFDQLQLEDTSQSEIIQPTQVSTNQSLHHNQDLNKTLAIVKTSFQSEDDIWENETTAFSTDEESVNSAANQTAQLKMAQSFLDDDEQGAFSIGEKNGTPKRQAVYYDGQVHNIDSESQQLGYPFCQGTPFNHRRESELLKIPLSK